MQKKQKLMLVYYYSEKRATSRICKVLLNMVFPHLGENGGVLSMRMPFQPLLGAGRKESSGTGLESDLN